MIHKIVSTIGLGVLGIDPITAVYMITMGIRKDKKTKVALFWFSFMGLSIIIGALLAIIFGASAVEFLESIMPGDNSPIWAVMELAVSVVILVYVCRKIFGKKKKKQEDKETVEGSAFKYLITGVVFAISCFTDPTYYAVILLGAETNNFLSAAILFCIWFLISQFMAVIVYVSIQLNLLNKLLVLVERIKERNMKSFGYAFYIILVVVSLGLLLDAGYYLYSSNYLF